MKHKYSYILFLAFIILVILFDAFQQEYFLETFDILGENTQVSIIWLLINHSVRWVFWFLFSIPFLIYSWRKISGTNVGLTQKEWVSIFALGIMGCAVAIFASAVYSIVMEGQRFTLDVISDSLRFFFFQKGLGFFVTSLLLLLAVYNRAKTHVIEAQWIQINSLKQEDSKIATGTPEDTQIKIRIGNRIKLIPISEITWIESDDYCAKIHTEGRSYSIRKSLKALEKELEPFQFVRIHRSALLNLGYMEQVDFEASKVLLLNRESIPISKKGAQVLRQVLRLKTI